MNLPLDPATAIVQSHHALSVSIVGMGDMVRLTADDISSCHDFHLL